MQEPTWENTEKENSRDWKFKTESRQKTNQKKKVKSSKWPQEKAILL